MQKAAAVLSSMPPRQRLLLRVCMTKNAGLLGSMCKTAFDWDDALDKVQGWMNDNPRLSRALIGAGTGATIGGVLGGWKGALAGGTAGGFGGLAWGENVAGKKALELAKRDAKIAQDEAVEAATNRVNQDVRDEATQAMAKQKQDMTAAHNKALAAQKAEADAAAKAAAKAAEERVTNLTNTHNKALADAQAKAKADAAAIRAGYEERIKNLQATAQKERDELLTAQEKRIQDLTNSFQGQVMQLQALVDQGKLSQEQAEKAYAEIKNQLIAATDSNPAVRAAGLDAMNKKRQEFETARGERDKRIAQANKAKFDKEINTQVERLSKLNPRQQVRELAKLPPAIANLVEGKLKELEDQARSGMSEKPYTGQYGR